MPVSIKPPRLWLKKNIGYTSYWWILDGRVRFSTRIRSDMIDDAKKELLRYVTLKYGEAKGQPSCFYKISLVLNRYLAAKIDLVACSKELSRRIGKLLSFWSEKTLSSVDSGSCLDYVKSRTTPAAARRELQDLQAAINLFISDGFCREIIRVTLPRRGPPRERYLTRDEAAKLVRCAWRAKGGANKHLARFIIAAVYTASRPSAVFNASYEREIGRPWIDLQTGIFHRAPAGEKVYKQKPAPPVTMPDRLVAHMRRWNSLGQRYLVEFNGSAADPKKSFARLVQKLGLTDVVRHTLRHTSITWLLQDGESIFGTAEFAGTSPEVISEIYGHHHAEHQRGAGRRFTTGSAGRFKRRQKG